MSLNLKKIFEAACWNWAEMLPCLFFFLFFFLTLNICVSSSAMNHTRLFEQLTDPNSCFVRKFVEPLVIDLNELDWWTDSGAHILCVIVYWAAVPVNPKYKCQIIFGNKTTEDVFVEPIQTVCQPLAVDAKHHLRLSVEMSVPPLENIKCLISFAILILLFLLELFDAHSHEKMTNWNLIDFSQLGTEVDWACCDQRTSDAERQRICLLETVRK